MIWGISLILLSIIAVPSLILSKKPNASELLARVETFQGWLGLLFCFWGAWGVINTIINHSWFGISPIWWATLLTGNLIATFLGFMLGSGLVNKFLLSNTEMASVHMEEQRKKIAPRQGKWGILGLVIGSWMIVASFLYTIA